MNYSQGRKTWLKKMNNWLNSPVKNKFHYRIGIDTGVGSLGIAIIKDNDKGLPIGIYKSHVFTWSRGMNGNKSNNSERDAYRFVSRTKNRIKNREKRINWLFKDYKLLTYKEEQQIKPQPDNVYKLRALGLDKKLSNSDLYHVVYFLAHNRGYNHSDPKSNGRMIKSIETTHNLLTKHHYRTLGEMMYKSKKFQGQKRNKARDNNYLLQPTRAEVLHELKLILSTQKKYNPNVTDSFIKDCLHIINSQRTFESGPGKNSNYVGGLKQFIGLDKFCPTLHGKYNYRMPKNTYTYEYVRLLSKLNVLKYIKNGIWHPLTKQQKNIIIRYALTHLTTTNQNVWHLLGICHNNTFNIIHRKSKYFIKMPAIHYISSCLPKKLQTQDTIDTIGNILTLYDTPAIISKKLANNHIDKASIKKLLDLVSKHSFHEYGNLSKHTACKLIPYLQKGFSAPKSEFRAGLLRKSQGKSKFTLNDFLFIQKTFKNPTMLKSVHVIFKALKSIIEKLGKPDYVVIESGTKPKNTESLKHTIFAEESINNTVNKHAKAYLTKKNLKVNKRNVLKLKKYNQQHGIDLYSGKKIPKSELLTPLFELDHIQPLDVSWNNSYNNITVTSSKCNRDKGKRTPLQWLNNPKSFVQRVHKLIHNKGMRINLLRHYPKKSKNNWTPADANNNNRISRFLYNFLRKHLYYNSVQSNSTHQTLLSNGSTTAMLRRMWNLIKDRQASDRHHGVDAIIISISTPAFKTKVEKYFKSKQYTKGFNTVVPYNNFLSDLERITPHITVRRLTMGNKNKMSIRDTKYSGKYLKDNLLMRRVPITKLKCRKKNNTYQIGFQRYEWILNKSLYNDDMLKILISELSSHHNNGKKAFPHDYFVFNNIRVYKLKVFKLIINKNSGFISKDKSSFVSTTKFNKVNIYTKNHKFYETTSYRYNLDKSIKPILIGQDHGHSKKKNYLDKGYKFLFCLRMYTPILIKTRKNKQFTINGRKFNGNTFIGYVQRPTATGSIKFQPFDITSQPRKIKGFGIRHLLKLDPLMPMDFFGNKYMDLITHKLINPWI